MTQKSECTIAFERYIDLALDDKIPWDEFIVLMKTFTTSFDDSQKLISALLNSLKKLKRRFLRKKKNKNYDLISLEDSDADEIPENNVPDVNEMVNKSLETESVTTSNDTVIEDSKRPFVSTLKIEPMEERNDFVFENELAKDEKVPKVEVSDMDIEESKPLIDALQQPKDTSIAQETFKKVSNQDKLTFEICEATGEIIYKKVTKECEDFELPVEDQEQDSIGEDKKTKKKSLVNEKTTNSITANNGKKNSLSKKTRICEGTIEEETHCSDCGKVCLTISNLKKHHKAKHGQAFNYKCEKCQKFFKTIHSIRKHERKATYH